MAIPIQGPAQPVPLALAPVEIEVDTNGDDIIADGELAAQTKPFGIWLNDDDDEHAPSPPTRIDYSTAYVDGAKDLEDLFPVFLDIQRLVKARPPSASVKYKLKQADSALNFVETNLPRTAAFSFRAGTQTTGFGSSLAQPVSSATTQQITSAGVELSAAFLNGTKDNNQGVILIEGRKPSNAPLVLTVEQNGSTMTEVALPLSIRARILLLLHGMNSNTATWDIFVGQYFGNPAAAGAGTIRDRAIQTPTAPLMTKDGVRCYRLQFGFYDPTSTRVGLEGVTAASTPNYLIDVATKRCGDFETFTELGHEVDDAVDELLDVGAHPENKNAQIILVGHSRGGLSARAFLQGGSPNRDAVIGLLTTGSPHLGSRVGRIYNWLGTHPRGAAGTDEDDWEVVDQLMGHIDVRRPVIGDFASYVGSVSAALTSLNAGAWNMPSHVRYGEIAYKGADLGFLAKSPVNYTIFDFAGINLGEQLSNAAAEYILDAGKTPADYPGDGLIPVANQKFSGLFSLHSGFFTTIYGGSPVLHAEEPEQYNHISDALHKIAPTWFP